MLLGDSIFDNAAYLTAGAPDVVRQVRQRLPYGSKATLAAVDGSRIRDVPEQLRRLPDDATYLHRPANLEDVFLRLTGRSLRAG